MTKLQENGNVLILLTDFIVLMTPGMIEILIVIVMLSCLDSMQ